MSAAMTSWRSGGNAYLALVVNSSTVELSEYDLPRPKSDEEAEPGEEEHSTVQTNWIQ